MSKELEEKLEKNISEFNSETEEVVSEKSNSEKSNSEKSNSEENDYTEEEKTDVTLTELEARCAEYETKIIELKKYFALQLALVRAGARSVKATEALIDKASITLDERGNAVGIEEQIEALKNDKETAFLFADNRLKGLVPQESTSRAEIESGAMTYAQLCEIYK